ncbi:MAG TPA: hypothetical protein V6C99_03450 [Oculatellaceae cyanobacterium]
MRCNFCSQPFEPDDIQLLRQDGGIFIVNVFCNHCGTQNGVAMVGVESPAEVPYFEDPELTPAEVDRLAEFEPITADDVLDAHHFFKELGSDWMKFIPPEMRQPKTEPQTESLDA